MLPTANRSRGAIETWSDTRGCYGIWSNGSCAAIESGLTTQRVRTSPITNAGATDSAARAGLTDRGSHVIAGASAELRGRNIIRTVASTGVC